MRLWVLAVILLTLCAPVCTGCAVRQPEELATRVAAQAPATASNDPSALQAPDGETAGHAVERLAPEVVSGLLTPGSTEHPELVEGSTAATPVAMSADYFIPGRTLSAWVLPNDATSVDRGMFAAMRPASMSHTSVAVPLVKDGMIITEFELWIDDGSWSVGETLVDPLPGGQLHDYQEATSTLREALGPDVRVRPVMFLPSGLEFAVGDNGGREAAVYLTFNNAGPGIRGFDKYLPQSGKLFTPEQLKALLTP